MIPDWLFLFILGVASALTYIVFLHIERAHHD